MGAAEPLLEVRDLHVAYADLQVLNAVSFIVREAEFLSVLGANGMGKSTLLLTISGINRPRRGEIRFMGEPIHEMPPYEVARRGIAHVPEGGRVFSSLTVLENLETGAMRDDARRRRSDSLEYVFSRFPRLMERRGQLAGTLSGGEQKMLAIGRGLMMRPRLLMLDEPSIGLAPTIVEEVIEQVERIHRDGVTVLLIEQNMQVALSVADRGVVLENGRLVLEGPVASLRENEHIRKVYLGL